jgi:hypothetical protein
MCNEISIEISLLKLLAPTLSTIKTDHSYTKKLYKNDQHVELLVLTGHLQDAAGVGVGVVLGGADFAST